MTRGERLRWVKDRALAYLPDTREALCSITSDLAKFDELERKSLISVTAILLAHGHLDTPDAVRKHIEGIT